MDGVPTPVTAVHTLQISMTVPGKTGLPLLIHLEQIIVVRVPTMSTDP